MGLQPLPFFFFLVALVFIQPSHVSAKVIDLTDDDAPLQASVNLTYVMSIIVKQLVTRLGGKGNVIEVGAFEGVTTSYLYETLVQPWRKKDDEEKEGMGKNKKRRQAGSSDDKDTDDSSSSSSSSSLEQQQHFITGTNYSVYTFDTWEDHIEEKSNWHFRQHNKERFFNNNRRHGKGVIATQGKSVDTIPPLIPLLKNTVVFAYIDGDHSALGTYLDAMNVWPMLKVGGYMLFDDYLWKDYENDTVNTPKAGIDRFIQEKMQENVLQIAGNDGYQMLVAKLDAITGSGVLEEDRQ